MRHRPLITTLFAGLLLAAVAVTAGTTSVAATVVNETAVDGAGNATDGGLAPIETTPDGESDNGSSTAPPSQESGDEDGASDRERSSASSADAGENGSIGVAGGTTADGPSVVPSQYWLPPGADGLLEVDPTMLLPTGETSAIRDIGPVPDGLDTAATEAASAGSGDQVYPFAAPAGGDGETGDRGDRRVSQRLAVPDGPGTGADSRDEGAGPESRSAPPVAVTGVAVLLVGLLGAPAAPELTLAAGRRGCGWLRCVRRRVGSAAVGERLPLLPVGGYSRYDDSDPLANETRSAIHELVTDRPGIYHARLADETGVAVETVRYHARILAEEGLVEERTIRGRRRLFPVHREVEDHRVAAALADPDASDVLAAIERREPTTPSALAEALGRARSTVSYHLKRLEEDGLVARERDGSGCLVRLRGTVRGTSEGVVTSD